MARRLWQFSPVILICCVFSLGLFIFSSVEAQGIAVNIAAPDSFWFWQGDAHVSAGKDETFTEAASVPTENIYLPAVFNNFPLESKPPVSKGSLDLKDLVINSLAAGTADRWTMDLAAGDMVTITVAPGNSADIVLSVLDSSDLILIDQQNLSPAGEVETITDLKISNPGIYSLLIDTVQGKQTDYALMIMDHSYSFVFRGTLFANDSRSDSLTEYMDHFWFFNAQSGETVSFTITPDSNGDAAIGLYDPAGLRVMTIDDTGQGEAESLQNYAVTTGGLYSIRVAEFEYEAMDYQIDFSKP